MALHRRHKRVPNVIYDSTVPIHGTHDDFPLVQDRSGVLVQIGAFHFLLTAVHKIQEWFIEGGDLFVSSGDMAFHVAEERSYETVKLEIQRHILLDEEHLEYRHTSTRPRYGRSS